MLFRNEYKELMQVLSLTKKLEDTLNYNGATGRSLSDKIKSFQDEDMSDFDEEWEFRQYKRELLGGNYNALRWVAHERNQVMHQSGYRVSRFYKYKMTILKALNYFGEGNIFSKIIISIFSILFYFLPTISFVVLSYYNNVEWFTNNPIIDGAVVMIVLIFNVKLIDLFEMIWDLLISINVFIATHKIFIFVLLASILFWNLDISTVRTILIKVISL